GGRERGGAGDSGAKAAERARDEKRRLCPQGGPDATKRSPDCLHVRAPAAAIISVPGARRLPSCRRNASAPKLCAVTSLTRLRQRWVISAYPPIGPETVHPTKEGRYMAAEVSRRDFLSQLGVTVGAAATVPLVGAPALVGRAEAQPKGNIPDTPYKVGHMTFFSGPGAVLGEPSYKGHMLAADEINAQGGLLGK